MGQIFQDLSYLALERRTHTCTSLGKSTIMTKFFLKKSRFFCRCLSLLRKGGRAMFLCPRKIPLPVITLVPPCTHDSQGIFFFFPQKQFWLHLSFVDIHQQVLQSRRVKFYSPHSVQRNRGPGVKWPRALVFKYTWSQMVSQPQCNLSHRVSSSATSSNEHYQGVIAEMAWDFQIKKACCQTNAQ